MREVLLDTEGETFAAQDYWVYILTSKRNASFTFDTPYFLNSRLILFKKFIISHSDIIPNQECKLVTFRVYTWKVIGRPNLLPPYATPVLIMDYSTKHRCIQSALLSPRKMKWRWCEIPVRSLQCKMFNSETFLGVVNVNVTNRLGNSHYSVNKSGCSEKVLKQIKFGMTIEHYVDQLSPINAFEVTLTFSVVTVR